MCSTAWVRQVWSSVLDLRCTHHTTGTHTLCPAAALPPSTLHPPPFRFCRCAIQPGSGRCGIHDLICQVPPAVQCTYHRLALTSSVLLLPSSTLHPHPMRADVQYSLGQAGVELSSGPAMHSSQDLHSHSLPGCSPAPPPSPPSTPPFPLACRCAVQPRTGRCGGSWVHHVHRMAGNSNGPWS
jgi:hypothetical protein